MKTYLAKFNPQLNKGVYAISLVDSPAMEGYFVALSKQEQLKLAEVDKEQKILMGLVLEPDKLIYRIDEATGAEYNIVFDAETIKELSHNFFKASNQKNSTIEHDAKQQIDGVTFVESWIVENPEIDKSSNFGFSYPKGSWIATMKVDSQEVWDDYVKTGKVKGFSVDAMLSLEEVNLKSINMSKEQEKSIWDMLSDLPNQIKLALTPEKAVKLGSMKTADGAITIEYDGEALMVGQSAWIMAEDGTKVPVPVGEHSLEDGTVLIVTEEGKVSEVKAMEDPNAPEDMAQPVAEDGKVSNDAKIASEIESAIKSILIKYSEQEQRLTKIESENLELKNQIVEFGLQPANKGIKQPDNTVVDLSKLGKKERLTLAIRQN